MRRRIIKSLLKVVKDNSLSRNSSSLSTVFIGFLRLKVVPMKLFSLRTVAYVSAKWLCIRKETEKSWTFFEIVNV